MKNYVKAFTDGNFLLYLKNSILINGLTAALEVIVYIILNKHITKGVAMGLVKG